MTSFLIVPVVSVPIICNTVAANYYITFDRNQFREGAEGSMTDSPFWQFFFGSQNGYLLR
jgi:hypothetical protein